MGEHGVATNNDRNRKDRKFNSKSSVKFPKHESHSTTYRTQSTGSLQMGKPQWKHLFAFTTSKHIIFLCAAIFFALLSGAAVPINSFLIGKIFSKFTAFGAGQLDAEEFKEQVVKYVLYIVIIASACWLSNTLAFFLWHVFAGLQGRCARQRVFNAMLLRPIEWYDRRKDGLKSLSTRLQSYIHDLQTATGQPMSMISQYLCSVISSFGLAFYLSWKLTLVIIAGIPIMVVLVQIFSSRLQPNFEAQARKLGEAAKITANAFSAIETVKCYNGEDHELQNYARAINESAHFFDRQAFWNALQAAVLRLTTLSMFVQGFWYGNVLLDNGDITASQILTAFWAAVLAIQFLMQIAPYLNLLEKGKMAGQKLRAAVFQMESLNSYLQDFIPDPDKCVGDILFENVSFSYPTRPQFNALRHANLFFAAGEITYVVGDSGSGKSTLGQLLLKFYNPNSGMIKLDNRLIQWLDSTYIRNNILLVEQESVLFTGTILENIHYGKPHGIQLSPNKLYEAAEFAQIRSTIDSMPNGFRTRIGPRGATLSGGQRQRIALARAWIRDPTVLVLDESTSALDYNNRAAVMNSIRKWRKSKTTIIITHDIEQILPHEFVYVMRDGHVVQEGFRNALEKESGSHFHNFLMAAKDEQNCDNVTKEDTDNSEEAPPDDVNLLKDFAIVDDILLQDEVDYRQLPIPAAFTKDMRNANRHASVQLAPVLTPFVQVVPSQLSPSWESIRSDSTTSLTDGEGSELVQVVSLFSPKFAQTLISRHAKRVSSLFQRKPNFGRNGNNAVENFGSFQSDMGIELDAVPQYRHQRRSKKTEYQRSTKTFTLLSIIATMLPQLHGVQRVNMLLAIAGSVVYAVSTPMFSYVFSKLLSTFYIMGNRKQKAMQYSLEVLAVSVIDAIAIFITQAQFCRCGQIWINSLRFRAFKTLLGQPRQYFSDSENGVSQLSDCLDQHAEEMQHILGRFLGVWLIAIIMVSVTIVWSLITCWKLSLVLMACSPILYVVIHIMQTVSGEMDRRHLNTEETASTIFCETLTSIKTLRSLMLESRFKEKYQNASEKALRASIRRSLFCAPIFGLSESSLFYINALIFYYGSILVSSGEFSLQDVFQTFVLLLFGVSNATMLISAIPQMSISREAANRVLRLISLPSKSHEDGGKTQISNVGDIHFQNVTFSYPSRLGDIVLRNFCMDVPAGTCVAFVGQSGSGKSTLANLLLKLYSIQELSLVFQNEQPVNKSVDITFSGCSIQHVHTPTLRSLVTLVSQTPMVFPCSVADNITYGLPDFSPMRSRANILLAAKAAGVHSFITSLPQGYDTAIGEGGTGLSGGQIQRLALARALVRNPDVLILDEVTSALDAASAALVRETIRNLSSDNRKKKITVILITHSREMMRVADQVCMLENGRLVEQGTYDELVKARGPFNRLVAGQKEDAKGSKRSAKGTKSQNGIFIAE